MIELCSSADLPEGTSKGFQINSGSIFIVRKDRTLYAYRNACPHLGIPLEWSKDKFLDDEGELIQCATHGALFKIDDGFCVYGPCANQSLSRISVEERDGKIYVFSPA